MTLDWHISRRDLRSFHFLKYRGVWGPEYQIGLGSWDLNISLVRK